MTEGIVFQVETTRVLQILSSEIYDSPLALLRENLQNAYDAIRMRFAPAGHLTDGGRIDIDLVAGEVTISDNGIGMTEEVLRENFWKAGSSGKRSDQARLAGVVGTFGIGAMANFGVCTRLTVETRVEGAAEVLRSVADRDSLKIGEKCIAFERFSSGRDVGTTVKAVLDTEHQITIERAKQYIEQYVAFLAVPVYFNGVLVSEGSFESRLPTAGRVFASIGVTQLTDNTCGARFHVHTDTNGQVLVLVSDIKLAESPLEGSMALLQSGGTLMGLRSRFGLATIPVIGQYQLGGFADLSFLQPTAGREALSRESIAQVTSLLALAERAASERLATTPAADKNNAFLQWLGAHKRYDLAGRLSIRVAPDDKEVALGDMQAHIGTRTAHYYVGTDQQITNMFANEKSCLFLVAQSNPRRNVQLHYLRNIAGIPQVPDSAQVTRIYKPTELRAGEVSVVVRTASILREDYLVPDVEVLLCDISHNVTVLPEMVGEQLRLHIARSSALLPPLLEFHGAAYQHFAPLMKDFVRVHIYPKVQRFVPSSTRDGVDALRKLLQRNRELYRYEEAERGDLEGILGEYLVGTVTLAEVLKTARSSVRSQNQRVSREQVGSVESVVPDVLRSPVAAAKPDGAEYAPAPPILRDDVSTDVKILTTDEKYPQLNGFTVLLGLSDRLMRMEADFFRTPHTTRILWGGHRVIYIFTEATERLSLYYDIELREPLDASRAGGGMFPSTTLITMKRIFVPVPEAIADEFRVSGGPKEFFVRFDMLSSDVP